MGVLSDLVFKAVTGLLDALINESVSALGLILTAFMGASLTYLQSSWVQSTVHVSQAVAGSLLGLKVASEAARVYVLHQSGDPSADPGGLLRRAAIAAGVIAGAPWLVEYTYSFGTAVAVAIAGGGVVIDPAMILDTLRNQPSLLAQALLFWPLLVILGLVLMLIVAIQAAIRAVELGVLAVIGPFMAVGLTAETEGVWGGWWRSLVVLSMTQAVQVFLLMGAGAALMAAPLGLNILMLIAVMWVAVKTPAALKEFAYHTGLGGAAGSAGQMVGGAMLLRRFMPMGGK